jgi:hypothetical protein
MPSEAAVQQLWIASLVIYFVVVAVVAVLLTLILRTAGQIRQGVSDIWTSGQKVANNTIHIPLLGRTNYYVTRILEAAVRTAGAVGAVEQHSASCPHCPACVLGGSPKRT